MGFLTTFTIYNDGADEITDNPEEFAKKIHHACMNDETGSIGLGSHANLIKHQRPRHSGDKTIYVHAGNTVVEMNPYSSVTEELKNKAPEFFDELIGDIEFYLKNLKALRNK